jgi:hypothetical protein
MKASVQRYRKHSKEKDKLKFETKCVNSFLTALRTLVLNSKVLTDRICGTLALRKGQHEPRFQDHLESFERRLGRRLGDGQRRRQVSSVRYLYLRIPETDAQIRPGKGPSGLYGHRTAVAGGHGVGGELRQ